MPWREAEYEGEFPSLGWDLVDWFEQYLIVPSGEAYGKPLVLTDEQVSFIVRYYRLDPDTGRRVYRRGAIRRVKGWGKSPLLAGMAAAELCGPVVFDGWDAYSEPIGRASATPWVQIAAVSEDQTGNTYSALYEMLRESPALDEFGIDLGLTRVHLKDRAGRIEPVTSSAGSREGQLVTFAVLDETHLWTPSNGGRRLAATIRRNLAKMGGGSIETTNAFVPGENSVAEDTHKAAEKQQRGLLYDAVEGPWVEDLTDVVKLREAIRIAYGDSTWVDVERIIEEVQDPATDPADARRFYLNQLVKATDAAVDPKLWARQKRTRVVEPGTRIGLGFDGSISGDSTVLVGCTDDGFQFLIKAWERPAGPEGKSWMVPRLEVHQAVADTFALYDVGRMLCDPPRWQGEIEEWAQLYGDEAVLMLDTNSTRRFALLCDRWVTGLAELAVTHDGSEILTDHVLAMARKKVRLADDDHDGRTRFVFVKSDTRKIDAGIGAVLAYEAAMTMPEPPATKAPFAVWR